MLFSPKTITPVYHVITQVAFSLQSPCAPVVTSLCWIPSSSCTGKGWEACSLSPPSWGRSSGLQPFYRPWVGTVASSTRLKTLLDCSHSMQWNTCFHRCHLERDRRHQHQHVSGDLSHDCHLLHPCWRPLLGGVHRRGAAFLHLCGPGEWQSSFRQKLLNHIPKKNL